MKRILILIGIVSLVLVGFGCSKNSVNSTEQANVVNGSAPDPFANITDANAALAEGNRLLDENQTEMAIAAYRLAVRLNPDLPDAYFQLGIAYSLFEMQRERSGEVSTEPAANSKDGPVKPNSEIAFEKAVDAYKRWIAANPKDDSAQFNLGRTYAKLMRAQEAEDAFRQAVKLKPDDPEYQTELGAILIKLAKYREAIDPLKKAVALDETNARAQDLLDDAEAGRQRLDYVAPKNGNTSNANANSNSSANTNANSNSNSASGKPEANSKPKKDEVKKTISPANKPNPKN